MIQWINFIKIPYFQILYVHASFQSALQRNFQRQSTKLSPSSSTYKNNSYTSVQSENNFIRHINAVQMRAEFSHDAITKDGTTKVQKEARTIKQLICVTSQLRICLVAFMLLQVWKEIKYSMEGNKQNIQWLPQKKTKPTKQTQNNSRLLKRRYRWK